VTRRYLLDTSVLSEPIRKVPSEPVMQRLVRHQERLVTAAPVWHEMVFGMERLPESSRRSALARYLERAVRPAIPVLPYDLEAASWHARERCRLSAIGLVPPFVDGQIAAIAAVNDCVLVTSNMRDFMEFIELSLEDWTRPPLQE
jgi:tRNA(fMet)-specific endonuclease VapC